MFTECGPSSERGPDAGSADQFDTAGVNAGQCVMPAGNEIKQELDHLSDSVKAEIEDVEANKPIAMTATPADSDGNDVSSTAQSESDAPAADIAKQDSSDVKSEDPVLKEDEDAMENDEQNADGKQSAQYWNYHWPKVCVKLWKCNLRS